MEIKIYFQIPDFWAYPNLQHAHLGGKIKKNQLQNHKISQI